SAKIDHRSDLYSLGVLFYQLVCGKVPFEGDSLAEIALAHIRTPLISPKQFFPDLPEVLNTVISKLLKKNPDDRFQSAQEVSKILNTILKKGEVEDLETIGNFLLTPGFVGRRKEFTELNKIFSEASHGKLKTILICGEQGVGKTKLWKEFRLGLPQNSTIVFDTKCRQNSNSFETLQIILSKALENLHNLSSKEKAEKIGIFGRDLVKILPQIEKELFFEKLPEIPPIEGIDSELRLFESFVTFLQNIQKENTTLVFFFDNLELIDEESLKFLGYLIRSCSDKTILVAGAIRGEENDISDFHKTFNSEFSKVEVLTIEKFTLEEVREFLTKMFGKIDPVNTRFCVEILKRTGGNVLFIQELMYHLLETKKLNKSEGSWELGEESFSEFKLPKSIQSVVGERLNFLPKNLIKLLEVGSLLGKHFTSKVVAGVLSLEVNEVESKLTSVLSEGILEKSEEDIFEFLNDAIRASISNTIKQSTKKTLHRKIAVFLENNYEESEVLEELANHYFEANAKKKALEFCLKVGEIAKSQQVLLKMETYFLKAYKLVESNRDRAIKTKVYKELAFAQNFLGRDLDFTIQLYQKAINLSQESDILKAELFESLSAVYLAEKNYKESEKNLNQALEIYEKLNLKNKIGLVYTKLGENFKSKGKFDIAISTIEKALQIGKKMDAKEILSGAYVLLGEIYSLRESSKKAETYFMKSVDLLTSLGNNFDLIMFYTKFGTYYIKEGNFKSGVKCYTEGKKLSEIIGFPKGYLRANAGIGTAFYINGKYLEAIESLRQNLKLAIKINDEEIFTEASILLAIIYNAIGDYGQSEKYYLEQIKICENQTNNDINLTYLYSNYCLMLVESNQNKKAIELADKALPIMKKLKMVDKFSKISLSKTKAYFALKDFLNAEKSCNEAFQYIDKTIPVIQYFLNLYKLKIDFELYDKKKAFKKLFELKEKYKAKIAITSTDFEICKIASKYKQTLLLDSEFDFQKLTNETIESFEKLYDSKPMFQFKKNIEELKNLKFRSTEIYPEIISSLTNWMNPDTVFEELLRFLEKETNSNGCQIILENKGDFEVCAISPNLKEEEIDFSKTVLQKAILGNEPILLKNVLEIPDLKENQSVMSKIFLSVIAVPLKVDEKIIGALYLDRTKIEKGFFEETDLEKVNTFAKILSPVLARQNEAKQMKVESNIQNLGLFVGNSAKMQEVYKQIEEASKVDFTVYIYGETGTGKELVANALHQFSSRKNKPFVAVNCSAIPKELAESEFFGHEKGAFSGAISTKIGKFEKANSGTLFLDEVAELSLDIQAKLLRVIQQREITRVGGKETIKVDIRIIIATHRDLKEEVNKGNFREDLFHRLDVLKIKVPSLGQRKEDIPLLAHHLLNQLKAKTNKNITGFTSEALNLLCERNWSGNIRELENSLAKAILKSKDKSPLKASDFEFQIPRKVNVVEKETTFESEIPSSLDKFTKLNERLSFVEKQMILESLKRNNNHLQKTYKELGIDNKRLDRLLKKHNIKIH
ncbi:MAG: AAA family ATPase, partial [Calditrichaeota bacterium]